MNVEMTRDEAKLLIAVLMAADHTLIRPWRSALLLQFLRLEAEAAKSINA